MGNAGLSCEGNLDPKRSSACCCKLATAEDLVVRTESSRTDPKRIEHIAPEQQAEAEETLEQADLRALPQAEVIVVEETCSPDPPAPDLDPVQQESSVLFERVPPPERKEQFRAKLDTAMGSVGMTFSKAPDALRICVKTISRDGLVAKWNEEHPAEQIEVGDYILQMNNKSDMVGMVAAMTQSFRWVVLEIKKRREAQ
mmetsp:Transcript_43903/g.103851  ORF Transcript_43903/g.103851 Transcript_43903/m.103851 type:complete len:199 (+) Transcript_43903:108-704(+)